MNPANSGDDVIVGHANTFHDPAIAIIAGDIIFAEALERHTQCKRGWDQARPWYSAGPLTRALRELGIWPIARASITSLSPWESSAVPNDDPTWFSRLLRDNVRNEELFELLIAAIAAERPPVELTVRGSDPRVELAPQYSLHGRQRFESKTVDHHLAHAAHAAYSSPFDDCAVMVIDAWGGNGSMNFYHFVDNRFHHVGGDGLRPRGGPPPVSLGLLYLMMTWLCGFDPAQGEEWKLMGLAAYGKRRSDIYGFIRRHFTIDGLLVDPVGDLRQALPELEEIVGGFRRPGDPNILRSADLAHNFQLCFEDIVLELVRNFSRMKLSRNLAYAGGCALNSSLNGKIVGSSGFDKLHVPSAPADDGNALGVALYEAFHERRHPRRPGPMSPYLGSAPDFATLDRILSFGGIKSRIADSDSALCDDVAELLAQGKIVGWMQGRAEFGPRALGNRSILADPTRSDMKDLLNARVKFREQYRPLAPSILHEFGPEYFKDYQESPYMERALVYREEVKARVPAVVHEDGTGRLQSVRREANPLFYDLISAFHRRTGVPMVLNTSFNVMGKPIIHSVEDAVTVLFTTGIDNVVIGRHILSK